MLAAKLGGNPDRLDEQVVRFRQEPLARPVFFNSVPKCGTHMLRNIVRMFVPVEQVYSRAYPLQIQNLQQHLDAFAGKPPYFSTGHMIYADIAAAAVKDVRTVVLVRDPYDYVLARARFLMSDQWENPLMGMMKSGQLTVDQVISFMIFGVPGKGPALRDVFTFHAAAWMGAGVELVRYEDVLAQLKQLDSPEAETFFRALLGKFGIDHFPDDWRERVRIGSDRSHSRTASDNLSVALDVPKVLSDHHKRLVDYAAPGLRALLGYA